MCQQLEPEHFTEPAYQEIVRRLATCLDGSLPYSAQVVLEALAQDSEARQVATELALLDAGELDEEVLRQNIENLVQHRQSGGHMPTYMVPPALDEPPPRTVDDFAALQKKVVEKLNGGVMDPDDPDIALYKTMMSRLHGKGALAYANVPGALVKDEPVIEAPQRADFGSVAEMPSAPGEDYEHYSGPADVDEDEDPFEE